MSFRIPQKIYGIIGHPLGHTMSPLLHNHGFHALGIQAAYIAWPVEPDRLGDFMSALRTLPISGLSVTIPHKQAVMPYLDRVTETAKAVGAVNTLYWDGADLVGENTDVAGFTAPLKKLQTLPQRALVLGAGGAARAVVRGLVQMEVEEIAIANRNHDRATILAKEFNVNDIKWEDRYNHGADLIINTTPLGMGSEKGHLSPWTEEAFSPEMVAYDLVYNPLRTLFLQQAQNRGAKTVEGLEMFLHQGLEQFRLFTGRDMDEDKARKLLVDALVRE